MAMATEAAAPRVVMWTAPRCISTALERAIIARGDCHVLHEPFGNPFYFGPERKHARYAATPSDEQATFARVASAVYETPPPPDKRAVFSKDMAYYIGWALGSADELTRLLPDGGATYAFLIRHPQRAVRSLYLKSTTDNAGTGWTYFDPREAGFDELHAVWRLVRARGGRPVVMDADDVLEAPAAMMSAFCEAVGLGGGVAGEAMCSWTAGPVAEWDAWPGWHDDALGSDGLRQKARGELPAVDGMPAEVREAIRAALPLYEEMYAARIRPGGPSA